MELWSKTILISVLDWSVMEVQSVMEITSDTSYLCIGSRELSSSCQKLLNFAQPLLICLLYIQC